MFTDKGKDRYSPFMEEKPRHKVITVSQWHSWTEIPASLTPTTRCFKIGQSHSAINVNNLLNILLLFLHLVRPMISLSIAARTTLGVKFQETLWNLPADLSHTWCSPYGVRCGSACYHWMGAPWMLLHSSHSKQIITWLTGRIKMEKNSKT